MIVLYQNKGQSLKVEYLFVLAQDDIGHIKKSQRINYVSFGGRNSSKYLPWVQDAGVPPSSPCL
jgi:hypothetical protein